MSASRVRTGGRVVRLMVALAVAGGAVSATGSVANAAPGPGSTGSSGSGSSSDECDYGKLGEYKQQAAFYEGQYKKYQAQAQAQYGQGRDTVQYEKFNAEAEKHKAEDQKYAAQAMEFRAEQHRYAADAGKYKPVRADAEFRAEKKFQEHRRAAAYYAKQAKQARAAGNDARANEYQQKFVQFQNKAKQAYARYSSVKAGAQKPNAGAGATPQAYKAAYAKAEAYKGKAGDAVAKAVDANGRYEAAYAEAEKYKARPQGAPYEEQYEKARKQYEKFENRRGVIA